MTRPGAASTSSIARLLESGLLAEPEVVAGHLGLARSVLAVTRCERDRSIDDLGPGTLGVLFANDADLTSLEVESAIRTASGAGLSGLLFLVNNPDDIPHTTRRLADKLGFPIIVATAQSEYDVLDELDHFVRSPSLRIVSRLHRYLWSVSRGSNDIARVLAALSDVIDGPAAIVDAEGRLMHGDVDLPDYVLESLRQPVATPTTVDGTDALFALAPLPFRDAHDTLWLVASTHASWGVHRDLVASALAVTVWPVVGQFLQRQLDERRENNERSLIFADLLEHPEAPPRHVVEHAATARWRLFGWHRILAVSLVDADGNLISPQETQSGIAAALRRLARSGELIERAEGWFLWWTSNVKPTPAELSAGVARARQELQTATESLAARSVRIAVGVSNTAQGAVGLRDMVNEAENSCLLARAGREALSIEGSDSSDARRFLTGYYASTTLRDLATRITEPLIEHDPRGDLRRTLISFLDNQSSTTRTARDLGLHRNTVQQRLLKVSDALSLDLDDPKDRLAIHLALHLSEGSSSP